MPTHRPMVALLQIIASTAAAGTNNSINVSDALQEDPLETVTSLISVFATVGFLFAFLIIAANAVILVAYARTRSLHNASSCFLVNLTGSDCFLGVALLMHTVTYLSPVLVSTPCLCLLRYMLIGTALCATTGALLAVCVERYLSVTRPFYVDTILTSRVRHIIVFVLWLCAVMLGLVTPLLWRISEPLTQPFSCTVSIILPQSYVNYLVMPIYSCVLVTIVVLYGRVLLIARAQLHSLHVLAVSLSMEEKTNLKNARLVRTGCIVLGSYLLSNLPFFTILPIAMTGRFHGTTYHGALVSLTFLACLNSLWNPLIYTSRIRTFRLAVKRLLHIPISDAEKFITYRINRSYIISPKDSFDIRKPSLLPPESPVVAKVPGTAILPGHLTIGDKEDGSPYLTKPMLIRYDSDNSFLKVKVRRLIREEDDSVDLSRHHETHQPRPKSENVQYYLHRKRSSAARSLRQKLLKSLRRRHQRQPPSEALPEVVRDSVSAAQGGPGGVGSQQEPRPPVPTPRKSLAMVEQIGNDEMSIELSVHRSSRGFLLNKLALKNHRRKDNTEPLSRPADRKASSAHALSERKDRRHGRRDREMSPEDPMLKNVASCREYGSGQVTLSKGKADEQPVQPFLFLKDHKGLELTYSSPSLPVDRLTQASVCAILPPSAPANVSNPVYGQVEQQETTPKKNIPFPPRPKADSSSHIKKKKHEFYQRGYSDSSLVSSNSSLATRTGAGLMAPQLRNSVLIPIVLQGDGGFQHQVIFREGQPHFEPELTDPLGGNEEEGQGQTLARVRDQTNTDLIYENSSVSATRQGDQEDQKE